MRSRRLLLALATALAAVSLSVGAAGSAAQPTVLWVFAHPDDETIGAGAALQRERHSGHHVVLLLTDGEATVVRGRLGLSAAQVAAARRREARAALAQAGVDDVRFAGLPDGRLTSSAAEAAVREVLEGVDGRVLLRGHSPDDYYEPYGRCGHRDHCAAAAAVIAVAADGLAADLRLHRIGHFFGAPRSGTCRQPSAAEHAGKQRMRAEYSLRDPAAGRLDIGWLSVPGTWQRTATEPECVDVRAP